MLLLFQVKLFRLGDWETGPLLTTALGTPMCGSPCDAAPSQMVNRTPVRPDAARTDASTCSTRARASSQELQKSEKKREAADTRTRLALEVPRTRWKKHQANRLMVTTVAIQSLKNPPSMGPEDQCETADLFKTAGDSQGLEDLGALQ